MAKLKSKTINEKFATLYNKVEREGMGFHDQMIIVTNILRDHGVEAKTAVELMHKASENVERRRPAIGEIERIVRWSYQNKGVVDGNYHKPKQTARRNQSVIDEWASKGSLSSLKLRSKEIPKKAEYIIEELYAEHELLHISEDIYHDTIKSAGDWVDGGLQGMQYFCPATFKGANKGRLAENVDVRPYLVFETDERPKDWDGQCGLIDRLSQELDLIMVTASGNKSLHALFDASTPSEDRIARFKDLVVTLGGDRSVLRPSQMVRFPWGVNTKTNTIQEVVYYAR